MKYFPYFSFLLLPTPVCSTAPSFFVVIKMFIASPSNKDNTEGFKNKSIPLSTLH